jgi:hypothetical protein
MPIICSFLQMFQYVWQGKQDLQTNNHNYIISNSTDTEHVKCVTYDFKVLHYYDVCNC